MVIFYYRIFGKKKLPADVVCTSTRVRNDWGETLTSTRRRQRWTQRSCFRMTRYRQKIGRNRRCKAKNGSIPGLVCIAETQNALSRSGWPCRRAFLLCHFEYPQQPQRSQHGQTERTAFDGRPHDLEYGAHDDDAIETVERRIEVYPYAERVHFDEHFGHEQHEEHVLRIDCDRVKLMEKMKKEKQQIENCGLAPPHTKKANSR